MQGPTVHDGTSSEQGAGTEAGIIVSEAASGTPEVNFVAAGLAGRCGRTARGSRHRVRSFLHWLACALRGQLHLDSIGAFRELEGTATSPDSNVLPNDQELHRPNGGRSLRDESAAPEDSRSGQRGIGTITMPFLHLGVNFEEHGAPNRGAIDAILNFGHGRSRQLLDLRNPPSPKGQAGRVATRVGMGMDQ